MSRWSKLQKALYNVVDPGMEFQIHCSVFKTRTSWYGKGRESVPRFWITIGKDVVWDFPAMFLEHESLMRWGDCRPELTIRKSYYHYGNYTWISETIRAYIDTPKADLLTAKFEKDEYGLADVLRAVDRRIGKEKRKPYIGNIRKSCQSGNGKRQWSG